MEKTKILTISTTNFKAKEGITTVIMDYYRRLDHNAFDLELVVYGQYNEALIESFRQIGVTPRFLPSKHQHYLQYLRGLMGLFRKGKYDVLYIHGSSALMSVELVLAAMFGCKKRVVHSHNTITWHPMQDKLLRPLFYHSYTDALACGTDAGRWLYGGRPFTVISNGRSIETYRFDPEMRRTMREQLGVDDSTLVIGHVGNFNAQKNHGFLLSVAQCMKKMPVKFVFIGEGGIRPKIMEEARELGLGDKILFTGSVSNVPQYLQAMDVMLLPSLHEGLPLVAIEWQIAALPCILSTNVTRECAYSDFVHFLPLEAGAEEWAKEVLTFRDFDRAAAAKLAPALTREHGFSLEENIQVLSQVLQVEEKHGKC